MSLHQSHLQSSDDLITTYEATRSGFVALALEKNRKATPYIAEARTLQKAASSARTPAELVSVKEIESGLLAAAGLSGKALTHLLPQDKSEAINGLIKNFLEPAGSKFIEELVFRFLLTRGDTLGGSMRNAGGALAQRKLTRAILSTLTIAGINYRWQHSKSREWIDMTEDDADIELSLRGLNWQSEYGNRTLIYNLTVPLVKNNIDICLLNTSPAEAQATNYKLAESYIALGELKGGIDPAGADEHWKTAKAALDRIRKPFSESGATPYIFFIGAAIEKKMSTEIWDQLESGALANAANLNDENQVLSISLWLCSL
ncbi:MAG: type II restriction endonuclease [Anaerolineales bacterium]|nr:type II restriction endonuclease [Anaerolineales bacterium]